MKFIYILVFLYLTSIKLWGQTFSGQIFMKEDTPILLNHIYITNLNTLKTVISNYNGNFNIPAKEGDVIRFTSIISDRKDIKITSEMLKNSLNLIELKHTYYLIPEVIIKFKPTGNLKADLAKIKTGEKALKLSKIIDLPQPKGNGLPPTLPPIALAGGSLSFSIDSIYDLFSGEYKKKQRQQKYERMMKHISIIKGYYGEEYFTKMKIPAKMIDNFLQFVYSSDNIDYLVDNNNLEAVKSYIETYVPIYLKRLRNSNLMQIVE